QRPRPLRLSLERRPSRNGDRDGAHDRRPPAHLRRHPRRRRRLGRSRPDPPQLADVNANLRTSRRVSTSAVGTTTTYRSDSNAGTCRADMTNGVIAGWIRQIRVSYGAQKLTKTKLLAIDQSY